MTRNYTVTQYNVHIPDSFEVSKHMFFPILNNLRYRYPDSEVWKRSLCSLSAELACHNFLYRIGIKRERTKDTDLNYPQPWYIEGAYIVFGALVWPFLK